jgi:hypothetical protein
VAFYGPDDRRATKVAVGILRREGAEADPLERWFSEETDVRSDVAIAEQMMRSASATDFAPCLSMNSPIFGCPHEEGIDYPDGSACPQCPFWANRDRWSGELLR